MIFNKEAQQQKNEYIIEISNAINRRGLKTHRQTHTVKWKKESLLKMPHRNQLVN